MVSSSQSFASFLWDPITSARWCLTDPGASMVNDTQLILGDCFASLATSGTCPNVFVFGTSRSAQ